MKLMIASDLHGSARCCEQLLTRMDAEQPQLLLLLGDLLYHGPRNALPDAYDTARVAALLNERRNTLLCVRGNCDTEVDQMVLSFPMLSDSCLLSIDGLTLFATHGHRYHRDHLPPLADGSILLHGHTHVPEHADCGTIHILNPGSVSIPKNGSPHSYMLYENGAFLWKTLDGDVYDQWAVSLPKR